MRAISSLAIVLSFGLASCSSGTSAGQSPDDSGGETRPTATSRASDGDSDSTAKKFTNADYEEAVRRTEECMAKSQVELVNRGWNPVNGQEFILTYRAKTVPGDKVFEIAHACRATHLNAAEAGYKEDNPAIMAPELMKAIQQCLTDKGIRVTGQEKNSQDLVEAVPTSRRVDLLDCVHDNGRKMYPALPITFP